MNLLKKFSRPGISAALLIVSLAASQAQTTATWIGPASGGEWNTAANWDTGLAPADATTNAFVGPATNVNYTFPMVAASFGTLTDRGVLNVNTNGFNSGTIVLNRAGGGAALLVNTGGAINVAGDLGFCSNSVVSISAGSSVNLSGSLIIGSNPTGGAGAATVGAFGSLTNRGGTLTATSTSLNPNNQSIGTSCRLVILGGANNLGAYSAQRSPGGAGPAGVPALGTDGLVISNGLVNSTSISLGNNAHGIIFQTGGIFTNAGTFTIKNATTTRAARFVQTGGLFVNPDPNLVILNPSTGADVVYSVLGGTNYVSGFQFGVIGSANTGIVNFTNAAIIYVGGLGIATNGATNASSFITITNNVFLNAGGKFGASADWTNAAPITLSGGSFDAQDAAGVAHNIYSPGQLRGSGALIKTGAGTLTLTATNNYTGATTISAGTLVLAIDASGSVGSIATSSPITVGTNATFDVSQVGGFLLGSTRTIAGVGTVAGTFAAGPNSNVTPAGSGAQGTLKFASGLSATNANFNMELTDDPTGAVKTNDFVSITGDLNLGGTNNVIVTPVTTLGVGIYKLIKFTGNFNGGITNLACTSGTLTNPPGLSEIDLIVAPARGPASLAWRGDGAANLWDTAASSNWLNGVTRDRFYSGDTATFDDNATNFLVTLSGILSPAAAGVVTINATNNYTFAAGGDLSGATGLTKTNSGKLTIFAANDYTGITTIAAGTLSVSNLAVGGATSPIGAAGTSAANLVFNGGTLEYLGANKTIDRSATILSGGATLSVSNVGIALTVSGGLTGAGALTKIGNGQLTLTGGNDYGGGTIINAGSIRANPAGSLGTNILTLNGGLIAANFQFSGDAQTLTVALNVVGNNNYLTVGGNDTVNALTGSGIVNVDGTGTQLLTFGAADMSAFTGTILWDTITTNRLFPNTGTSINAASTTFDLGVGSGVLMNRDGGNYRLGALAGGSSTQLRGSNNSGSAATTYVIGEKNVDSTFAGVIRAGTGGAAARVVIVKAGLGKLTLTGANTYNGSTTISNGVLALGDGVTDGSISSTTNINIVAGAFLDASGRSDGTFALGSAQTLRGGGTLRGVLDTTAGGTVSPGATIGTLTVTNSIILGGNVVMEINRATVPNADKLVSLLSTITYGGTLTVNNLGGGLQVGDTFTLFSGGGLSGGTFATFALPNYYNWDVSQLGANGSITVTGVLPLPTLSADFSALAGGSITLNGANGAANGPFTVLSSTNVALPLSQWTTAAGGNFDGGGIFSLGVTVDPAAPQEYFIILAK